jgi:hypothetical protein
MGNIVAGEALRLLKEEGNHNSVSHYVAAQAAISAHAYDSTTTSRGKDMNKDPDVYGYYWQPGCTSPPHKWRAEGRPCYFARIRMPKGARYISHHNMDDYALEIWHYNNDAKPSTYYDYNREKPVTSFFHDAGTRRLLTMPNDRYEIFSWAAEADSSALGAEPGTAGVFTLKLDLMAAPYNLDSSPKSHSAQFRSYIQKRWDYWHETIKQLDITPSLKKP